MAFHTTPSLLSLSSLLAFIFKGSPLPSVTFFSSRKRLFFFLQERVGLRTLRLHPKGEMEMCKPACTLLNCLKFACLVLGADAFGVRSAFLYPNLAARHDRFSKYRRTLMSLPSAEGGVSAGTDACASRRKQISLMVYQLSRIGADLDVLGPAGDSVRVDELGARIDRLQQQLALVKQHNIDMQMGKF